LISKKCLDYGIISDFLITKTGCESLFCRYWKYYLYAKNPQKACLRVVETLLPSVPAEIVITDPLKFLYALSPLIEEKAWIEIYFLTIHFASNNFKAVSNTISQEDIHLKNSANLLYDSMIIQKLLVLTYNADSKVSQHIYRFIHQFYVDNPAVLRLVHFQGYSLEFVPMAVKNVASLCIFSFTIDATVDFLPELLTSQKRFPFGIAVAVSLCQHYPVPRT
jgi:hypothetical protein